LTLSSENITSLFLCFGVMLFFSKLLGELFYKIKQPAVIGEIIAGIILGPTVLGNLFPEIYTFLFNQSSTVNIAIDVIVMFAVVMLLLISGLEVNLGLIISQGKAASSVGTLGVIIPFIVGFIAAYLFPHTMGISKSAPLLVFALFIGTALSISALPVIAKTLIDLNLFRTKVGLVIIAAAMFNDLIGWLIFSLILGMMGRSGHGMDFVVTLVLLISFTFVILIIGRRVFDKSIFWLQEKLSPPGAVLNFIFIMGFLGAAFSEFIGIHPIFGAFIMGIAIGDSVHLKEQTKETVFHFVNSIFAPLFFVSIGLRVDFINNFNLPLVLIILVLAFVGKILGSSFGAYLSGMKKDDSLAVGIGMNSRGAMEIILGLLALQFGIIHETVFVALVVMALITSITSPPLLNFYIKKSAESINKLLRGELVFISGKKDKVGVIKELIIKVAEHLKLDKDETLAKVMARERVLTGGIENHLAIIHAKIKIKEPVVAVSLVNDGVDFSAMDGKLSHIIFLLLSPEDEEKLHLQMLAEIVKKFKDLEKIKILLNVKSDNELLKFLKAL
jgi:Kef-type K+ transport system membrane component KefB/mannitol/fructose-specific phosphotransferase system IIA component (Ntr-type)